HSDNATITKRENILPTSRYFTDSNSNSQSDTDSHTVNLGFDVEVDSTFLINVNPTFRYSKASTTYNKQESSRDDANVLTNESSTSSFVENTGKSFVNELEVTKRFGKKGSFLRFGLNNDVNSTES